MPFKRAGGSGDTLSSRLAPQASVVKGREIGSPLESLHRIPVKETAKMSIISAGFRRLLHPKVRLFFPCCPGFRFGINVENIVLIARKLMCVTMTW